MIILSRSPYRISGYTTVIVGVDITWIKQRLSPGGAFDRACVAGATEFRPASRRPHDERILCACVFMCMYGGTSSVSLRARLVRSPCARQEKERRVCVPIFFFFLFARCGHFAVTGLICAAHFLRSRPPVTLYPRDEAQLSRRFFVLSLRPEDSCNRREGDAVRNRRGRTVLVLVD